MASIIIMIIIIISITLILILILIVNSLILIPVLILVLILILSLGHPTHPPPLGTGLCGAAASVSSFAVFRCGHRPTSTCMGLGCALGSASLPSLPRSHI